MATKSSLMTDINEETVTQYFNNLQDASTDEHGIEPSTDARNQEEMTSIQNSSRYQHPENHNQDMMDHILALSLQQEETRGPYTKQHEAELSTDDRSTDSPLSINQEEIARRAKYDQHMQTPDRLNNTNAQRKFCAHFSETAYAIIYVRRKLCA
ncbi:hypothetical protein DPMN_001151 [Dreissena polymorpha]|uniref:Uncharacterized protein n=1 Tax=Dreissena polymorpha TaxID=45954 RepID=A0A9D4RSK1_DREPO|nr:hypothetical protein DPMN_001151 [Dreissena polymorpha]